jgi:23S rRNA (adenine2503-C2)-methyltransferase
MGFTRNLTPGEIVEQVLYFERLLREKGESVTNIVYMGMGEPFHNYDAVIKSFNILNHHDGFNLGARRFTISTVGLIPGIERFAEENNQVNLAISLHATDDKRRSSIMPVNDRYPIKDLIAACHRYFEVTGRRITFEWALIQGVNDSTDEANALADLLLGLTCHVNVIPLNPTAGYDGKKSDLNCVNAFQQTLQKRGVPCTVRIRRGIDIQAGCGQLASKN